MAQLKPGKTKKIPLNDAADLKIVPDVGDVYPAIKSRVLHGTVMVMTGLVPLNADIMRTEVSLLVRGHIGSGFNAPILTELANFGILRLLYRLRASVPC